ncbi:hypothetical protein WJX72_006393 [[Myrmecia] bisecta]|uniref:Uncharacterized protein n=1 Tax=[Myrmecia] bisecta TaxID=41462 RepID=A0AAW1R729_9CHLO
MDQAARRDSGLRASAAIFLPNTDRPLPKLHTKPTKYPEPADFDALTFTPSAGICTPSPTNGAAYKAQYPLGRAVPVEYKLSPRWSPISVVAPETSATTDSHSASSAGGAYAGSMSGSPTYPLLFPSPFYWPMPVSPTAFPVQPPASPFHSIMPGSPMQQVHTTSVYPGSPVNSPMYSYQHHSPFLGPGSPPHPQGHNSGSGSGDDAHGQVMTDQQLADALNMVKINYGANPPEQLINLAMLMQAYGLLRPVDMSPAVYASLKSYQASSVPITGAEREDLRAQAARAGRRTSPAKIGNDGLPKLNARQRRTLRRAHKRAQDALALLANT